VYKRQLLFNKIPEKIAAIDLNYPMLLEHKKQRDKVGGYWPLANADMRWLPFAENCADVITAGWAIGHLRAWFAEDWQNQIGKILREMQRLVVKGGTLIIMETLSTGSLTAQPPTPELAELYAWFENKWGFTRKEISTDYLYSSVEEAVKKTEFFFGSEMAEQIRLNQWARLPEWTGIWYKTC
jgi:ubiquinone/menaquinone biosynthesis C-methylase UbiE